MAYSPAFATNHTIAHEGPHGVIQVVPNQAMVTFIQGYSQRVGEHVDIKDRVPFMRKTNDTQQDNIYVGELAFYLNKSYTSRHGIVSTSEDRMPILVSAGGIPAFTEDESFKNVGNMSDEKRHQKMVEILEDAAMFAGVTKGNWWASTPDGQNEPPGKGLTTLYHGVKTIVVFCPEEIEPGTDVVFTFPKYHDIQNCRSAEIPGGSGMLNKATVKPRDNKELFSRLTRSLLAYHSDTDVNKDILEPESANYNLDDSKAIAVDFGSMPKRFPFTDLEKIETKNTKNTLGRVTKSENFKELVERTGATSRYDIARIKEERLYFDVVDGLLGNYHRLQYVLWKKLNLTPRNFLAYNVGEQKRIVAQLIPWLFDDEYLDRLAEDNRTGYNDGNKEMRYNASDKMYHLIKFGPRKLFLSSMQVRDSQNVIGKILRTAANQRGNGHYMRTMDLLVNYLGRT